MSNHIKKIMSILEGDNKRKVVKVYTLTKEQEKKRSELEKMYNEKQELDAKYSIYKSAFWSNISIELNDYRDMKYNTSTKKLESYEDEDDDNKGSVISPLQIDKL